MFHWNTDKIIADLMLIDCVVSVKNQGPGGDVDTDNLRCEIRGVDEGIYVCGFNVEYDANNICITNPAKCEVEMINLTDQSGDGLQTGSYTVAEGFIKVRQYFIGQNAIVINRLKDYF